MKKNQEINLYLVMLGGSARYCNIELHDIRWVAGRSIEDTFINLREEWFGIGKGLHIDSFMEVKFIDGYAIRLNEDINGKDSNRKSKSSNIKKNTSNKMKLWFVNLGAYRKNDFFEQHKINLIVAENSFEAKHKAMRNWNCNFDKKHKDNISQIKKSSYIDNCNSINSVGNWTIELIPDEENRSQSIFPDWHGYKRIDIN